MGSARNNVLSGVVASTLGRRLLLGGAALLAAAVVWMSVSGEPQDGSLARMRGSPPMSPTVDLREVLLAAVDLTGAAGRQCVAAPAVRPGRSPTR
jgi:hypothetical protein